MDRATVVGIDVGGTRIKAVRLVDGLVANHVVVPSPPDLAVRFAQVVQGVMDRLSDESAQHPTAVGVVVPGLVDDVSGSALWSANLGWRDLDIEGVLSARLGIPVRGGHDVRAGLLAEYRLGAAMGCRDVLFVPLGTGLASALMVRGEVVADSPWAGEIGHVIVRPDGPRCGCGRIGCLEAIASAAAIGHRWTQASGQHGDAETVAAAVRDGDPVAGAIWAEAIDALATMFASVVAAAGTERIVVGGGLVKAGAVLMEPLSGATFDRLPASRPLDIVPAALGEWAGAIGAACLAQDLRP